jgi:AcrR family transcriptional regulator
MEQEKKEDRRVRRTKKLLTQALTQLLQEKQVNEITVRELTDLADMNRGTFYLYYKDIFDMLEKIEDSMFAALDVIMERHEKDALAADTKPILLDLFNFIQENKEMSRVLLSVNGDMNFLHRLNEVVREKCRSAWLTLRNGRDEDTFDYHYSFVVFGCAGVIRAWVNRDCPESAEEMAELSDRMIRRGSLTDL